MSIRMSIAWLCLDVYSAEICPALRFAEDQAVSLRRVCNGIVPGWSSNHELVSSCQHAKFWFLLRKDCGHPKPVSQMICASVQKECF